MRKISLAAAPRRPWKNGGGETRELVVAPPGAGLDDFDWRISCAQVASGGPFSAFPGVDRSLLVLEGAGLRLDFGAGEALELDAAAVPLQFAGEQPVTAELLAGPVGDFNVMTRRARWCHRLQVLVLHGRQFLRREAELELLYCAAGRIDGWLADARPFVLAAGEGLLFGASAAASAAAGAAADAAADATTLATEGAAVPADAGGLLLFEASAPTRLLRVQLWRR
ncbi:HutD family protein [Pseudomonas sp. OF001]|uniref:HutD/Ves family protein n=1 Tax=Pseudomonas sp. OF001 TaxID=2772300 RepID=UPI001918A682|nr:HutD family protein [Pseudomonas sp. OF001]CAD5376226.1 HutD family protein [Pseudomonas sp. OF001]